MLEYIAGFIISPFTQSILLLGIGYTLAKWTKLPKYVSLAFMCIGPVWLVLCSQFMFSHWVMNPLENKFPPIKADSEDWQQKEAIWVLACYHFDALHLPSVSQFNSCSLQRLVHAANMYRVKNVPIYLTGGKFNDNSELSYASQAAIFLKQLGVNENDLIVINEGTNTKQESTALLQAIAPGRQTLAVVSSASHGTRITAYLNNVDFVFIPVNFSVIDENHFALNWPNMNSISRTERAFYEYAAILKMHIFE